MRQLLISLMLLTTPAFASTFSPYVDLTINTHWDSKTNTMAPMDLLPVSNAANVKSYHLAFINDIGNCQPAWGSQEMFAVSRKWGAELTDALRVNGISNIVAFGGASGQDISKDCNTAQLATVFEQVMTIYQPQGLDFDIENGSANVPKLMASLATFQIRHPATQLSFTLPTLPEGLTAEDKNVILKAKENGLNYHVNIMAMDYGPAYTNDMGAYAVQAATALHDFLAEIYPDKSSDAIWSMVEVTPMIGTNDVNVEQFTLANVDTLRNFADSNRLGGLSMWSVMRDQPCADRWASPVCSGNNAQKPYDYARRFTAKLFNTL
jgi:chitinase